MIQSLPFSRLHQLADLSLYQVTLQRADVADVKLAVQVFGFVKEGACQQFLTFFSGFLVPFSVHILGANRDLAGTAHGLAKFGNAKTAFGLSVFALRVENL